MANHNGIPLVSSEISGIWNSYIGENISTCAYKYFSEKVEDNEIRTILQHSLKLSSKRINELTNIFNKEKLTLPDSFNDNDINLNAPALFTDTFYLQYLMYISGASMQYYSRILRLIARSDIREYFSKCISEDLELFNRACEISASKGILIRTPRVEIPKEVQYIKSESFILDWFGKKRSMLTDESTCIFFSINNNVIRKALLTGFHQVCKDKKVSDCLERLMVDLDKESKSFNSLLEDEGILVGGSSDSYVTDSTVPPFSDKLVLTKIMVLYRIKINNLGSMVADLMRSDITDVFMKNLNENIKSTKELLDIMVKHEWLQQPPQAIKHENLAGVK